MAVDSNRLATVAIVALLTLIVFHEMKNTSGSGGAALGSSTVKLEADAAEERRQKGDDDSIPPPPKRKRRPPPPEEDSAEPEPPRKPKNKPLKGASSSWQPPLPPLDGLQTPEQFERMMAACPSDRRVSANTSLPFVQFMNNVFNALSLVAVNKRPIYYLLDEFPTLWEARGALFDGFWAEYGVFRGGTLIGAHRHLKKPAPAPRLRGVMAGFDSFEGLPEKWREGFNAGAFGSADLYQQVRNAVPAEVELYKGWFQDTITDFLVKYPRMPAAAVHHDGDLYVSTSITFAMLDARIVPGTFLIFDELHSYPGYEKHEILSLYLWLQQTGAELCAIANHMVMTPERRVVKTDANPEMQSSVFQVLSRSNYPNAALQN